MRSAQNLANRLAQSEADRDYRNKRSQQQNQQEYLVVAESIGVENGQIKKIPAEARRLENIAMKGLSQFEGGQQSQEQPKQAIRKVP